jgi:hypothetical protein
VEPVAVVVLVDVCVEPVEGAVGCVPTVIVYVGENPVAPAVSHALTAITCPPGAAVTGTDNVWLLMIGPYWTPSSQIIMPSIVAPDRGCALALTVNGVPTVAWFPGVLSVTMSFVVADAFAFRR